MAQGDNETEAPARVQSESTKRREAFFIEFATAIRDHLPKVALMVTGGFKSRRGMEEALSSNSCDLIGLGRASVINPRAPQEIILNEDIEDKNAVVKVHHVQPGWLVRLTGIKSVGAGAEVVSILILPLTSAFN